jgi:hypothetical protein
LSDPELRLEWPFVLSLHSCSFAPKENWGKSAKDKNGFHLKDCSRTAKTMAAGRPTVIGTNRSNSANRSKMPSIMSDDKVGFRSLDGAKNAPHAAERKIKRKRLHSQLYASAKSKVLGHPFAHFPTNSESDKLYP